MRLLSLACLIWLGACGAGQVTGGGPDASPRDASSRLDAAAPPLDAAVDPADAALEVGDTAVDRADAAPEVADAAPQPSDSGTLAPDAAAPVDAGPACPPPPADLLQFQLGGYGNPIAVKAASGQMVSLPLPVVPGAATGHLSIGESAGAAGTPSPVTLEISINRCPGVIDGDLTNYCNLKSQNGTYNAINWFNRLSGPFTDPAQVNANGYCWAPESEGPWFINGRWTYTECAFGMPICGFMMQHNQGPY